MRIHKVYIEKFKNLQQFEISLNSNEMNTVLLGQNATGKSNFIEDRMPVVSVFSDRGSAVPPPDRSPHPQKPSHRRPPAREVCRSPPRPVQWQAALPPRRQTTARFLSSW